VKPSHRIGADTGSPRKLRIAALTSLLIAALGISALNASASGPLPVSPAYVGASSASGGLEVRPATITYTGDGTGFLGGAGQHSSGSGIDWRQWTSSRAVGSGFNQINDCKPFCAAGKFHGYAVRIELWRPRAPAGTQLFTRMTIFYKQRRPRGEPRHYTFTDLRAPGGGYGWGPPDAQGYCVHTFGQKPAAGCANIRSLP